jgi:hypothetical protein
MEIWEEVDIDRLTTRQTRLVTIKAGYEICFSDLIKIIAVDDATFQS